MKNNTNKYFLYARKSSEAEDRQAASIDDQINELTKIAKQENINIVEIFSESKSAKAPGRPVFNLMMDKIAKKEADGILCWKLNRLARNAIDGGLISHFLQKSVIQHIQTYGKSYYPTDNVIVMAVELGMANQFIRDLSIDTQRGLRQKAERGWYPAHVPPGYAHNPLKKKGEKEIIRDKNFDLIRKMFDLILNGQQPLKAWKKAINDWGLRNSSGKKIPRTTFYRMITSPFYYGEYEYPKNSGNWFTGKHPKMITISEYDRIQNTLGREGKPRPKKYSFPFTGIIRCGECGGNVTAEQKIKRQKNGNIHYYTYYHCTKRTTPSCKQKFVEHKKLEKQISSILEDINIPPEFAEWAYETIQEDSKKEIVSQKRIITNQQKEYNACLDRINGLVDMRANKEISADIFKDRINSLECEKKRIKRLIDESDEDIDNWMNKLKELFEFAETAKQKFDNGTTNDKRMILSFLGSNLLLKDRELTIELKKPLTCVKKMKPEISIIHNRLEPLKNGLTKQKLWANYAQSTVLLRGWDSNPRPID